MRSISHRSAVIRLAATAAVATGVALATPLAAHADSGLITVTFTNAQGGLTGAYTYVAVDSPAVTLTQTIPAGTTKAEVANGSDHTITVTLGTSDPTDAPGGLVEISNSAVGNHLLQGALSEMVPAGV